jgi:hypothetical protein
MTIMKSLKIFMVTFAIIASLTASSQTLKFNAYGSTNDTYTIGGDLIGIHPNGIVFGIGGSHASKTFFTSEMRNGNDYSDHSNNIAKNYPELTDPANAKYIRERFVENRGTLTGVLGYSFNKGKTIIVTDLGIAFQQEITLATTGQKSLPVTPASTNYWQSRTVGPAFVYGGTIMQTIKGRFGVLVGYNNIQELKLGISYRITPTKMFKW